MSEQITDAYELFRRIAELRLRREARTQAAMSDAAEEAKLMERLQDLDMEGRDQLHTRIDHPAPYNVYISYDKRGHQQGKLFVDIKPIYYPSQIQFKPKVNTKAKVDHDGASVEDLHLAQAWARHSSTTAVS